MGGQSNFEGAPSDAMTPDDGSGAEQCYSSNVNEFDIRSYGRIIRTEV